MDTIYSRYSPHFLYVDRYVFPREWVYREEGIPYAMFRYILSGYAEFMVDGVRYEVAPDDVFYIPQGCNLYCAAQERLSFISVRFIGTPQLAKADMLLQLWHIGQKYGMGDQPEIRGYFEKLLESAVSRTHFKKLETRAYLNLILAALARKQAHLEGMERRMDVPVEATFDMESLRKRAEKSRQITDPRIRVLVDYLTLHPNENLTREQMCRMCEVSESTLRRLFHQYTGKTVYEFLKDQRMVQAARRLVVTNESVASIGYELGYESPSYFCKTFRETYGVSPLEYRRRSEEG